MPEDSSFIPIAKPWLGDREARAARRAILSGWVTQGPEVEAFESEFADFVGARHACAVSNCTSALHLALRALGVKPGDEVVTVSHSFIATANSIVNCGAIPVFVDIQPDTFNIDPERLDEVITERTRAILCVHQMGMPCDLPAILKIAREHGLPVIEDAACAAGSEILCNRKWEKIGGPHGDIACFSFHPRKIITTGDGGILTTANDDWDCNFRLWRQQGMGVPDAIRHKSNEVIFESYPAVGYNYRMTDIQAAVGREQLKRLPEIISRRRQLAKSYREALEGIDGVRVPDEPEWARSNWQSYCVRLADGFDQRKVMQLMLDQGVATRRGVMCVHREPAYARQNWLCRSGQRRCECPPSACVRLEESERAQDNTLSLPLFHQMTSGDQDRVVKALKESLFHA